MWSWTDPIKEEASFRSISGVIKNRYDDGYKMLPFWFWNENDDESDNIAELERSGKEEDIDEVKNDVPVKQTIKKEFVPFNSLTLEKIIKQNQRPENADEIDEAKISFFKKNKRKKPVKYDIQSLFAKSGLSKNTMKKWYYPVNSGKTSLPSSTTTTPTTTTTATPSTTTTATYLPTSTVKKKDMKEKISSTSGHLSSFADNVKKKNTALNWLKWINQRSKLKLKTSTTAEPTTTTTMPPTAENRTISIDPFLELLSLTNLHYPGPRINSTSKAGTSTTIRTSSSTTTSTTSSTTTSTTTTTTTTTTITTSTTIRKSVSTTSPSTATNYQTWSWWSPSNEIFDSDDSADAQEDVENENSKLEALNKYEEQTLRTTQKDFDIMTTTQMMTTRKSHMEMEEEITTTMISESESFEPHQHAMEEVATSTENNDMNNDDPSDKNSDLRDKYHKLVEHNSKLVDLLKTTMQIQTDMFRKLIHYVFP